MAEIATHARATPWLTSEERRVWTPTSISAHELYKYLVDIEEHPEVLPLASDLVQARLDRARRNTHALTDVHRSGGDSEVWLDHVLGRIAESTSRGAPQWRAGAAPVAVHYFVEYLPTALVDGCWLQGGLRAALAHTSIGAALTGLYQHQVCGRAGERLRHFVVDYVSVYGSLTERRQDPSRRTPFDCVECQPASLSLPILLLAIAQFTRTCGTEIIGLNLAWQFLGLSAFGPMLVRDVSSAHLHGADDRSFEDELESRRMLARDAALRLLNETAAAAVARESERLLCGVTLGVTEWTAWFDHVRETSPAGPDPRQEMIDMLRRKAPHAHGYHGDRTLGGKRIDAHLAPDAFDGPAVLAALAASPWVRPGDPDRSPLLNHLIAFGGPMLAVFSPFEIEIIKNWIASLAGNDARAHSEMDGDRRSIGLAAQRDTAIAGLMPTAAEFRRRSEARYGGCTTRDLYYYLVNVDAHPDILPIAERFACDRLERAMAGLWKGERPIPSASYDPAALERWLHDRHREQVDSYRRPDQRPEVRKEAFIEATVQLAPLILIDGAWLQGIASPAMIDSTVGRMLFHVLIEEIGEGIDAEHHANIYRDLLTAMGEEPPPVDSWEFAHWARLNDSSFDVPALWLSLSCFPRHFLPELLGLNLAVELAGVGGPYLEARDTLRQFGYPSVFVDVHNAADNVSMGHAAWAMHAIRRYMEERAERDGPHSIDPTWHRVWSGVRATIPPIGRARAMLHRAATRLLGADAARVPRIFLS